MSILLVDSDLAKRLDQAEGTIQVCTRDGRLLGYFSPAKPKTLNLEPVLPAEELRRRESEPTRPLAEILRTLERSE